MMGFDQAQRPQMLAAALAYAQRGLAVFPLAPRGKRPLSAHGVHDATTDEAQIRAWWDAHPAANIGLACGVVAGVDVLDVDGPEGEAALAALETTEGELPMGPESRTHRGRHLLFAHHPEMRNSAGKLGPKLDTRADGGYIVAPPSVHPEGSRYRWSCGPDEVGAPAWPSWALDRMRPRPAPTPEPAPTYVAREEHGSRYAIAALEREASALGDEAQGGRNAALNRAAYSMGQLVAAGALHRSEVYDALLDACRRNGLLEEDGRRQFDKTFRSGFDKGAQQPRQIPEPSYTPRPERAPPPVADMPDPDAYDGAPDGGEVVPFPVRDDAHEEHVDPYRAGAQRVLHLALADLRRNDLHPDALAQRVREELERIRPCERRGAKTPADVIEAWRSEGPLVHEATGIETLDEATTGGPVYGSRWFIAGAPDAGKTALLVQIAHTYAERGVMVGLLAVDEEPGDMLTRFAQRVGHTRQGCEVRYEPELDQMKAQLGELPLRFYDAEWTIERAAEDLARQAEELGMRAALGVDSVQTVQCDAELAAQREVSTVDAISKRAMAIRAAATKHRMIVLVTSEMNRGAYRSKKTEEQTSDMAAAKGSGAIEYQARVLVTLRSEPGRLVRVSLPKNKHRGPGFDMDRLPLFLRLDPYTQTLEETEAPEGDAPGAGYVPRRTIDDAAATAAFLAGKPGLGTREVRAAMRAHHGMGSSRVDAALSFLGDAVVRVKGPRRNSLSHYLDGRELPETVLSAVVADSRTDVITARPPTDGGAS